MAEDIRTQRKLNVRLLLSIFLSLVISGCLYNQIRLDIEDGAVVKHRMLTLTGSVNSANHGTRVQYLEFPDISTSVEEDGSFTLSGLLLSPGDNQLTVASILNERVNGETRFSVIYQPESGVSAFYSVKDREPIELSVSDQQDPAYGAELYIEAGSIQIPAELKLEVGIVSEPEHMPILPQGYQAIGSPVTFQPIGQSFSPAAIAKIPYSSDKSAEFGGVPLVLALGDNGWQAYPHTTRANQLEVAIDQLFYGGFIVVVEEQ